MANTQVVKIKPSFVPFVWKGAVVIVLGVFLFVAGSVFQSLIPISSAVGLLSFAGLGLIALGVLMMLIGAARRSMYTYQLTDSHVVIQKQLLGRSVRRMPFTSISDVEVSQSLVGRLLGYGNIIPVTKSGYGLVRGMDAKENIVAEMTNVPNPDQVANLIMSRVSHVASAITPQS
jgi:uncharacterized membrane protein YdbT with pleckstrin-like domain